MWTLLFRTALANGQTSHVWITEQAVPLVTDPELAELLTRDDLRVALVSGTMFPDGGYAVDHPYGEEAHWEPFQTAYLEWIRDTYGGPPWSDDAARHIQDAQRYRRAAAQYLQALRSDPLIGAKLSWGRFRHPVYRTARPYLALFHCAWHGAVRSLR